MPEGHTLHRLAAELTAHFADHVVEVSSPQERFASSAALVDGSVLLGAAAWGKHLFIEFEGLRFIHVHLGLYGKFAVSSGPAVPAVGQVRLRIVSAGHAAGQPASYADLRGATTCELITETERLAVLERLGPDPLREEADPLRAWTRISRSKAPIGVLLMDQTVLAGVGNVYRAELLFRHRMHPLRPGNTVRRAQFHQMWQDLVQLMPRGVATGSIDTVRDEHIAQAVKRDSHYGRCGGGVYVYRRQGQPCRVCGAKVRTEVLAGRNLFWCPRCQPKFRSRATGG